MKRAVAASLSMLVSACSLALGLDKDDYTRGAAVAEIDAGQPPNDGGVADGPASGGEGGEGGGEPDVGPASPCATTHLACDDFDEPGSLTSHGWEQPFVENGSTLAPDALDAVSAPNSLKVVGLADSSSAIGWPPLLQLTSTKDLTLAYDLRAIDPGPGVAMTSIHARPYGVRIVIFASGVISLDEWDDNAGRVSNTRASTTNVKDRWVHVELTLHFVPDKQPGSRVVLKVDGNTVVDDVASPTVNGGPVGFDIGDIDHPNGTVSLRFDNVTFDAK